MNTIQKIQRHDRYWTMKPPTVGAITGLKKLAAENRATGTERWLCGHISVMEPPEFVTFGDLKNPEQKRNSRREVMLGAKAHAS